ncbi:nicotinate phosphoribosyltransferase [Agarivorans sp.]|uniref:nicotinate phosphoribosyltransferase n=1 Tax=Agarivorans sp. TaxID=1872412 RepID=UPI003D00B6DD
MMSGRPLIQGILDTDFYKLTMAQAYLHQAPNAEAEWEFKCRSEEDLSIYVPELKAQVESFAEHTLSDQESQYLRQNFSFISDDYLQWLKQFRYQPELLSIEARNGQLVVSGKGPQLQVSPFEIPLMAALSEIRNRHRYPQINPEHIEQATNSKIKSLERMGDKVDLSGFRFADFGTRRRFSYAAQQQIIAQLQQQLPANFVGTSNPLLAKQFNLACIGTMAHEWFQTHQQLGYQLADSQRAALENWITEYRDDLGIALTDIIGIDAFCRDLNRQLASNYSGFRHDSGDPILWGEAIVARLEALQVDPSNKTLVFSDGLNFERAVAIYQHFHGRIGLSFGIGTWLMGDLGLNQPINMVMKMVRLNGHPVAKISDSPGKTMCRDRAFLKSLMKVFAVNSTTRNAVLAQLN